MLGLKSEPSSESTKAPTPSASTEGKNETKAPGGGAPSATSAPSTIQLKALTDKLVSNNKVPHKSQSAPTQTLPPPPTQRASEKNPALAGHKEGEQIHILA